MITMTDEQLAAAIADGVKKAQSVVERKFTPGMGLDPKEAKITVTKDAADQPFPSFGSQMLAVKDAAMYARRGDFERVDKRLFGIMAKAATGGSELVPADGGFLVAQEFIPTLIDRVWETGVVSALCADQQVGPNFNGVKIPAINETSRADGSRWGGVRAYWASEAGTLTPSKPTFRQVSVELQKLIGLCYATDELLQDSVALESHIMRWFPMEFGFKMDDAVINGDGVGKPLGVLSSPALYSVAKETNQVAATVVTQNIIKMWQHLWAPSRKSAIWVINQEVETQLDQLSLAVGTAGIPVYMALNMGLTAEGYMRLKGRPVIPIEQCAALGTKGDILLIDPQQYLLIKKGTINTATSIHVQFVTDETAFRFTYRVNGQPYWNSYVTPFKGTNYLSPFISLDART